MNTIYFDSSVRDDLRRQRLYNGQIFAFSPRPSVSALRQLVCNLIEATFGSPLPPMVEKNLPVEEFLAAESSLKQQIINHPQIKQLIQSLLQEFDCDLSKTYFDLPQLRIVPFRGYLPNNEGLFHDPHRDTWYAAPQCLINWWIPLYEFESESALAFHPLYWNQPVNNDSRNFNQEQDYKTNFREAEFPHPEQKIEIEPEIRIVCPTGGVILFSGAQMHSAVPNTSGLTRYSLDLRTVHFDEIVTRGGAPNIDSNSTSALLTDFMRGTDLAHFPDDLMISHQKSSVALPTLI
ncbi:MAG: phytanoyl-CoA dioxygenase family protein [Potamolinea sp.]